MHKSAIMSCECRDDPMRSPIFPRVQTTRFQLLYYQNQYCDGCTNLRAHFSKGNARPMRGTCACVARTGAHGGRSPFSEWSRIGAGGWRCDGTAAAGCLKLPSAVAQPRQPWPATAASGSGSAAVTPTRAEPRRPPVGHLRCGPLAPRTACAAVVRYANRWRTAGTRSRTNRNTYVLVKC